ncbi:YggS family pyridoxal phosphate enzyme [endosymbiont 'TC1' of Trimyema compressum]|uniref:YggS family pyridoxal phosphate-dependent enzyme n=1 Tax=endosymbiont 'TC1' of Trimyema compressum TaxID=243899 RepID=UPI0007F14AC9|nr:YggS family pyridoxal phosphate-dependent enzyme [endosymbiont 'TC1' of Trimyema compressum]AMP21389.1 YggS family pyridoxal phosphate enzyme [endosymbiont 'TC1' of Trimyema compressum]
MNNYLENNLKEIRENIDAAKKKAGRVDDILLLGVTKTFPVEIIEAGIPLGIRAVGENKAQELVAKYDIVGNRVSWHFIGHLQRNKVKYIIDKVDLIHSVESVSLAKEIGKRALQFGHNQKVLLEINISGEETKFGLKRDDVVSFIEEAKKIPGLQISGLMTMAPHSDDTQLVRGVFKGLRLLKEEIESLKIEGVSMDYLSMGMSHDYELAILEGANIVRIGSLLYGKRDYTK